MNSSRDLPDLRVRRTHKLLWDALMALMIERDFESITVTDICDRAMVHRTTFYKHFEDKYDLLLRGMQDMHATFVEEAEMISEFITLLHPYPPRRPPLPTPVLATVSGRPGERALQAD